MSDPSFVQKVHMATGFSAIFLLVPSLVAWVWLDSWLGFQLFATALIVTIASAALGASVDR